MLDKVLESCKYVVDNAEYVKEARRVFDSTLSAKEGIKLVLK